jgi:lipopolysaccharide/colanic/teichoic acid biosynthesis glycosyltransferase
MSLDALWPAVSPGGHQFLASVLVIVGFLLGRSVCHGMRIRRRPGERLLILGTNPLARRVIEEIGGRRGRPWAIVAVVEDAAKLDLAIEATRPDRIIVALGEGPKLPFGLLLETRARGIVVERAVETYERLTGKLALEALPPSRVLFSRDFEPSRLQLALTRQLSLVLASLGLIVCLPLLAVLAVAIKLDSRGPVFFVQERVGRRGRTFRLVKFRTMHPIEQSRSEWERDNWDRITRLGRWLRRYRLDELPQLLNVLRGHMNLVGPRPHPVTNLAALVRAVRGLHEDAIPYYVLRCAVRPGITGWAQVRYRYANSLEEEMEKARYDLYYVKNLSLWLDVRILVETLKAVFTGRGLARPVAVAARGDGTDRREAA